MKKYSTEEINNLPSGKRDLIDALDTFISFVDKESGKFLYAVNLAELIEEVSKPKKVEKKKE